MRQDRFRPPHEQFLITCSTDGHSLAKCPSPWHLKQIIVFLTYFLKTFFLGINIGPEGSDILIFYKKKGIVLGVNIGPNSNVLKIKPWHLKHF